MKNGHYKNFNNDFERGFCGCFGLNLDNSFDNGLCGAIKCEKRFDMDSNVKNLFDEYEKLNLLKIKNEENFFQILHDIKSPITAIKIALEGVLRNEIEDEIYQINLAVLSLIDDFVSFYRFNNAEFSVKKEKISIKTLVTKVLEQLKYCFFEKNINIKFDEKLEEICVFTDEKLLERIFSNIVFNASKYCPSGGKFQVWFKKESGHVKIFFKNNIFANQVMSVSEIFNKFNTSDCAKSYGMGLDIAKKLCEKIGAMIFARVSECRKPKELAGDLQEITFEIFLPKG